MQVLDIMTKSPAVCTVDSLITEVARMMADHDCGAIPVVESRENPRPVGIVTDRDIVIRLVAEGKNPIDAVAEDAMTGNIATVRGETSLAECAEIMERNQVRRVPVLSSDGKIIGIVAQADVAVNDAARAAELVAEISEEDELLLARNVTGDYSG